MAENNNLDDLILSEPEPDTGKSKSVIFLLGLILLLVIIGAVLASLVFGSSEDDNKTVQTEKVDKVVVTQNDNLNNQINKGLDTIDSNMSDNLDKDLALADDNLSLDDNLNTPLDSEGDNNKNSVQTQEKEDNSNENVVNENALNSDETADTNKAPVVEKIKKQKNKITNSSNQTHKIKPQHHLIGGSGNVYIQVGSFAKGPNEKFIDKIRRAGFKYRIKNANGYRRVLVGPFKSTQAAKRYLPLVKSKISQAAFIKK